MKIGTLSVLCGTPACQASCNFCIAKMTGTTHGVSVAPSKVNWRNLDIACRFAEKAGATTCLITGKGEPTLYPDLVPQYIQRVAEYFPFIEIQSNGIDMVDRHRGLEVTPPKINHDTLSLWQSYGLTLVCLSIVHYERTKNSQFMYPNGYYDFWDAVKVLHNAGIAVRINCTMVKNGVDDWDKMKTLIEMCKERGVEQLTLRDVAVPDYATNEISEWTRKHQIKIPVEVDRNTERGYQTITEMWDATNYATFKLEEDGAVPLLKLNHGATVYDYKGQNVSLNNCITENTNPEEIRQLIFFPDGSLRFSWNFEGARIL